MRLAIALLTFVFVGVGSPCMAQVSRGEIFGKVIDATGAVLPGVAVTLESPALIQPQVAVTARSGGYRFASLPIGVYTVRFALAAFNTLVREGVRVEAGFNAEVDARLEMSSVHETVTVSGRAPVVDPKVTQTGGTFSREVLDAIPSARDPWVILEQVPGMVMSQENVGGNLAGQQSGFAVRGNSVNQSWNLDGATITDMAGAASPAYYDFDEFEEIQVQTGGGDASTEAGGVSINMITKSGGNTFKGSAKFIWTSGRFQSSNITDDLRRMGAGSGNPISDIKEYGFEIGGPIKKDRVWFWGGYRSNPIKVYQIGFLKPGSCTDTKDKNCLMESVSTLNHANVKATVAWTKSHRSNVLLSFGQKLMNARDAGPSTPADATRQQRSTRVGPFIYKFEHQWVASDRLMFEGKGTFSDASYVLDFQRPELADVQPSYDISTLLNGRSAVQNRYNRPNYEARIDGNYYAASVLGGDHALKFGFRYRKTPYGLVAHTGGGAVARFNKGVAYEGAIVRDGEQNRDMWAYSAYVHDTFRRSRWTVNAGVRWDFQDDKALSASIGASPILPDLLPAIDFKGADSGVIYSNFGPRFGLNYDLFGTAKTLLKFNASRYYGIGIWAANRLSPTGQTTLTYPWNDANGDKFVQREELNLSLLRSFSSNWDPAKPASPISPQTVDPNIGDDITNELLFTVEHELMPNFGVGLTYIWRSYTNSAWEPRVGLKSTDFVQRSATINCGNTTCDQPDYTVKYWELPFTIPAATIYTNSAFVQRYQGIELTAHKRLSNRWMMTGSFTWNHNFGYNYGPDSSYPYGSYQDPTNILQADGKQLGSWNAKWVGKLFGMYALPWWDINTSVNLDTRQGYPFNPTVQSPTRSGSLSRANVYIYPVGTKRYQNLWLLNWRVDKSFKLGRTRRLSVAATVFNALNSNTVLARVTSQSGTTANNVTTILAPRVLSLSVRFLF